jgi:hypothetical protein
MWPVDMITVQFMHQYHIMHVRGQSMIPKLDQVFGGILTCFSLPVSLSIYIPTYLLLLRVLLYTHNITYSDIYTRTYMYICMPDEKAKEGG